MVSPEQQQQLVNALVNLGAMETQQGLHAEGVRAIQELLQCSIDEARAVLRELRMSGSIEETASEEPSPPVPHFRWVKPPTPA
jgi:hypothetical protein